jgi:hypothetical protein
MSEPQIPHVMPRTSMDDQALELGEEFGFHVWVDFRDMSDGMLHWHARREGWLPEDILNGYDYEGMRNELIIYTRRNPELEVEGS